MGDNEQLCSLTFSDAADPVCLLRTLEASGHLGGEEAHLCLSRSRGVFPGDADMRRATDGIGRSLVFPSNTREGCGSSDQNPKKRKPKAAESE
jgi:hypothetical protein